jgi:hypothetical protein
MGRYLEIGVAVFAFIAAAFWFASAAGEFPRMLTYCNSVPPDDPYYVAVKFSALMIRWAAFFSGLLAVCAGVNVWVK